MHSLVPAYCVALAAIGRAAAPMSSPTGTATAAATAGTAVTTNATPQVPPEAATPVTAKTAARKGQTSLVLYPSLQLRRLICSCALYFVLKLLAFL